ncbi:PRC-barrel domain containing protein [Kitasatospora sp. NPDC088346]|uniref:PRC-barrel domain containing protein n=1 Tax=Kitasatospora sp. NPDC088346 TaxID=3364073 RepID=UPI0038154201
MTQDIWNHRPGSGHRPDAAPVGYRVEATDGPLGTVDRHSDEVDAAHLVVDTGPWILGREVLLPAGVVRSVDHAARTVHVGLTRDGVRNAPAYVRAEHTGDRGFFEQLAGYYGPMI